MLEIASVIAIPIVARFILVKNAARLIAECAPRTTAEEHDGQLIVHQSLGIFGALVAWASGYDPDEPANAEEVIVIVDPEVLQLMSVGSFSRDFARLPIDRRRPQ